MLNVLDLFCGCGGLSSGFHSEKHFNIVCAIDIWKDALKTYSFNYPKTKTILGDISMSDIKNKIITEFQNLSCDIIIGGPPCQSFSMAGKRNIEDPRGVLFEDYIELVKNLNPKLCIIENVKGILSMKHYKDNLTENDKIFIKKYEESKKGVTSDKSIISNYYEKVVDKIINRFAELGYKIEYKVLDCSFYGVPQKRERVIFIATRLDCDILFPKPTHTIETMKCVKETIDDLKDKEEDVEWSHIFSKHSENVKEKIKNTKIGTSMSQKYNDAFFKCDPNKPSRTVKENHGGVFLHYEKNRVMTPRELARLQSFPDTFHFCGTKSSILKQIGNAVPPQLSIHLATVILQMCCFN
jgi:DNA (cytosine-5)-methyltransferase 1